MSRKRTIRDLTVDDARVHMVRTLVHMSKRDEAAKILQQLVNHTRILMRRKLWKVGLLCEFYPKNKCLLGLNVNKGSKVMIRLRCPSDPNRFLPYESLLGTMIHELVHIAISPHNSEFYQMVDDLSIEVQKDVLSPSYREYTAEMEFGKGYVLGGNTLVSRKGDPKELIRKAAIRRQQSYENNNDSGDGGGRKLGGRVEDFTKLDPRELRLQAIQKRLQVIEIKPVIPLIPKRSKENDEAEQTCHDQLTSEEEEFLMQNTQDIPIINLIDDDDEDEYIQEEGTQFISQQEPRKEIYCKPCVTKSEDREDVLISQTQILSSDDQCPTSSSSSSSSSSSLPSSSWLCSICLENNSIEWKSCSWCGRKNEDHKDHKLSKSDQVIILIDD